VFEDEAACDEYIEFLFRLICLQPARGVAGNGESNGETDGREGVFTLACLAGSLEEQI
jgi:hypothetical protein